MKPIRCEPIPEKLWDVEDLMTNLDYSEMKAKKTLEDYHHSIGDHRYGPVEKELLLDFINQRQRIEREREAKHQADLASVETITILKEQVKALKSQTSTLQKMCDSSSSDARKARTQSLIANFISGISIAIAIIALALKLN